MKQERQHQRRQRRQYTCACAISAAPAGRAIAVRSGRAPRHLANSRPGWRAAAARVVAHPNHLLQHTRRESLELGTQQSPLPAQVQSSKSCVRLLEHGTPVLLCCAAATVGLITHTCNRVRSFVCGCPTGELHGELCGRRGAPPAAAGTAACGAPACTQSCTPRTGTHALLRPWRAAGPARAGGTGPGHQRCHQGFIRHHAPCVSGVRATEGVVYRSLTGI